MHDKNDRFSWHSKGQSLTSSFFTTSRAAWQWWLAEMAWLIKPVINKLTQSQTTLVLVTDAAGNPGLPVQNTEQIYDWQSASAGRPVVVLLHPEQVLRLPLTLPRSARPNLRSAVQYRLVVEAPVDETVLYFDIGDITSAPIRDEIVAEVALCKRLLVDNLEKIIRSAGATSFLVGFSPSGGLSPEFKFYTSHSMQRTPAAARLNRWLIASAIGITLAIGPALYTSASWLEISARTKVDEERAAQGNVIHLAEEHARIRAIRDLLAQMQKSPGILRVMEDLAMYLPNQAWISQLQYEHGYLKLLGYAVDPTAAARALERSENLKNIKLESVSQQEPGTGGEGIPQFVLNATFANKETK